MPEELNPQVEECRQLSVNIGSMRVLFKFESEDKVKEAKVSFDLGNSWLPLLHVKKALDSFNDRYPVEL